MTLLFKILFYLNCLFVALNIAFGDYGPAICHGLLAMGCLWVIDDNESGRL